MISSASVEVGSIKLSAISAKRDDGPIRANIIALPGGGHTSRYWHHPAKLDASLLALGASLGYNVVAFDRPGYGTSSDLADGGFTLISQIDILKEAISQVCAASGVPEVFLIGHSMGGILSIMLAASGSIPGLLGLDVSGVPLQFSDDLHIALSNGEQTNASHSAKSLFYGPGGTFDASIFQFDNLATAPVQRNELDDSALWPSLFPSIASKVEVPVQYTLAEHDLTTPVDETALALVRDYFASSPRIETRQQIASGHNTSLHHVARAYHLRALAFFDETLATRLS